MTLTAPTATSDAPAAAPATWSVPPRVRAALAVLAALAAFAPSLSGLVADLRYGAPTGDLVVVPLVSAVMLDAAVRSRRDVWAGRLGHGDLVVAAALAVAALLLVLVPAGRTTNGQWLTRLDLLAHPVALAAFAVLLLGLRSLAVALVPLLYGLLVWPWPVTWLNIHAVAPLTAATYQVSGHAAQGLGFATMVDVGAENTLRIGHAGDVFEVVVAPACSGISGIAAYLVVAGAVVALTHGRIRSQLGWVLCGVTAVWVGNVLRIVGLTAAGRTWGADVALDLLHPVAGLAIDAVVVVALVASLRRFGIRWAGVVRSAAPTTSTTAAFSAPVGPPSPRSIAVRAALVAALSGLLLVTNLAISGTAAGTSSAPPERPLRLVDVASAGTGAELLGREDWSKVYFGAGSVWNRYRVAVGASGGPATSSVWVDSLLVEDRAALEAHDVLGCYGFHGAEVTDGGTVRVAGRFVARRLVVVQATGEQWQSLYWEWPVATPQGLRHERVTLFVGGAPAPTGPAGAGAAVVGTSTSATRVDPALAAALVTAADRIAAHSVAASRTVGAGAA